MKDINHDAFEEVGTLADHAGLSVELIGEWNHPRSQKMLCFRHLQEHQPARDGR